MTAGDGKRVLQLLQPEVGAVPQHVLTLTLGLRAVGWNVEVATSPGSDIRRMLERAGIIVHLLPLGPRRRPFRFPGGSGATHARCKRRLTSSTPTARSG